MAGLWKSAKLSKHKKLSDKWHESENKDCVAEGIVTYIVKYLGSTLVEELDDEEQSYGNGIAAEAVHAVLTMAKATSKKLPTVRLDVSSKGISSIEIETGRVLSDLNIYRISFCSADRQHSKVFAYVARNRENETMECHAFLCPKRKIAEAITLTVAESFSLAKQAEDEYEKEKILQRQLDPTNPLRPEAIRGVERGTLHASRGATEVVERGTLNASRESIGGVKQGDHVANYSVSNSAALVQSNNLAFEDNFADMQLNNMIDVGGPKLPISNAKTLHNNLILI